MSSAEQNRCIVDAYVDAFNRGDLEALCGCFGPGALVHGVLGWGGVPEVKGIWRELIEAFAINLTIEDLIQEGSKVAVRYTERGTFRATFRGQAPTGKSYEIAAMEWFEIADGKLQRRWGARDSASMFRQMGATLP